MRDPGNTYNKRFYATLKLLPALLPLCLLLHLSVGARIQLPVAGELREQFDPSLTTRLRNIEALVQSADLRVGKQHRNSLAYANFLDSLISRRFFHGYSSYTPSENWIASFLGKYLWLDLGAKVIPDHIMRNPMAACSQQAIVLMACFREIGTDYRAVRLNGHFTVEGKIGGRWYYFDPNLEPVLPERRSLSDLMTSGALFPAYSEEIRQEDLKKIFSKVEYGGINEQVAWKAVLFHRATGALSFLSPVLLVLFAARQLQRYRRSPAETKAAGSTL